MATIKLGPKFFRKERDNLYSAWDQAFWREMLQNSIDAGSTSIRILVENHGPGTRVVFDDNGTGMDRKVVEDVFFALGETTKGESSEGVGGFGRARILTCFAMDSYSFRTQNLFVKGQASDYEIEETAAACQGCKFSILVGDKTCEEMLSALSKVLSMSQIDLCDVYVNDQRWTNWMHRRRLTRELKCGGVYVNNSQPSNGKVIVRVKGLYMFDMYTSARPQVIVEIDPKNSRNVLTVNRDGMHYSYQSNITQFLNEIAVDKNSALRSRQRRTTLLRGNGLILARKHKVLDSAELESLAKAALVATSLKDIPKEIQRPASSPVDSVCRQVVDGDPYSFDYPSVYINDETENPKVIKVMPQYDPRNWVHSVKNIRGAVQKYRKGSTYLKLLLCWKIACEEAIDVLINTGGFDEISWLVGWDFSDITEASHINVEGAHALCLNPVSSDGTLRFGIRSKNDLRALMALAKHEVAHISVSRHDEDFSTVHTQIDKMYDPSRVLRKMKESIESVNWRS